MFTVTQVMMRDAGYRVNESIASPCICEKRVGRRINILTAVIAKDYLKDVKAFICLQEL